jgi:hypothetical protein
MTCFDQAPATAQSEFNAAGDCNCQACATPCAASCNGRVRGGTTAGTTGGTTGGTDTCDSCAVSSEAPNGICRTQFQTCQNDTKCSALITCFGNCGSDATCRMNCYTTAGTKASNEFNAIAICVCQNCSSCSARCSGMP